MTIKAALKAIREMGIVCGYSSEFGEFRIHDGEGIAFETDPSGAVETARFIAERNAKAGE